MIINGEADIVKVPSFWDRQELRNFRRFLRLWPHHGYDMVHRPRWQKYLNLTPAEVEEFDAAAAKRAAVPTSDKHD